MNKYDFLNEFLTEPWDYPDQEEYWDTSGRPFHMNSRPKFSEENFLFLIEQHNKLVKYLSEGSSDG